MDYNQQSAVEKIQNILKPYSLKQVRQKNEKAKNAKLLWNASAFFSKVVMQSKPNSFLKTVKTLEEFTANYNKTKSDIISLNELFEKHWLRSILGFVHIPPAVRSVVYDYEKQKDNKHELLLLRQLVQNHPNYEVTIIEYENTLSSFQKEHNISIDEDWLKDTKRITNNDGVIKIAPVEYYYLLLDNWEVFTFLYVLRESKDEKSSRYLTIDKTKFDSIYEAHKTNFKVTPSRE